MLGANDLRFLLLGLLIRIISIIIFLVSLFRDCAGVRARLSWGLPLVTTALPDTPESRLLRCCRTHDARARRRATRRPAAPGFLPAGLEASGLLGLASMSVVANSLAPGFPFLGGFSAISFLSAQLPNLRPFSSPSRWVPSSGSASHPAQPHSSDRLDGWESRRVASPGPRP